MSENPNRRTAQCPFCSKLIVHEHGKPPTFCEHCYQHLPPETRAQLDPAHAVRVSLAPQAETSAGVTAASNPSKTPLLLVGIVMVVVAVAVIIISQNLFSLLNPQFQRDVEPIRALQSLLLLGGIGLLIFGGIISAVGFSQFISTRPTTPFAPTTQPVVTNSVSAGTVELGNTPDKVQSVMGHPDKIIDLGPRVIHVYKDMKIIYDDGKVSDVQLS